MTLHRWQQEGGILLTVEDGQDFFEVFENFLNGESRPTFFDRLSEKWGYVVYTGYDTSQIPVRKRPGLIKYFILILFYACLAGPGLYLILKKKIFLVRSYTAFCSFPWYCSFAGNRHQTDCPGSYHETDVYPAGSYLGRNAAAGCAGAI